MPGRRPNPEALRLDSRSRPERAPRDRGRPRGRLLTPRRAEVVERLGEERMLPAIYFIFSRAACDDDVNNARVGPSHRPRPAVSLGEPVRLTRGAVVPATVRVTVCG